MAVRVAGLYPSGFSETFMRVMLDASCSAGAVGLRSTATNSAGEVVNATTTGAADALGVYSETKTYSATQSDFDGFPSDEEGTVGMICDPFQVLAFPVAGGATAGLALNSTAPANILTNTSADTTGLTITAAEVGTVSMAGGILVGRTGNNAGLTRRSNAHTNSTSCTVEVPFPRTLEAGATFFRFPWSLAAQVLQFTSNLVEADGTIVTGTGAPMIPVNYRGAIGGTLCDLVNSAAVVFAMFRDHAFNPLS